MIRRWAAAHAPSEDFIRALWEVTRFSRRDYVTGIGIGEPREGGKVLDGKLAITVQVREKLPNRLLRKDQIFPRQLHGVRLDVVQRNHRPLSMSIEEKRLRRFRPAYPAVPGVEVGVEHQRGGTLGLLVYDRTDGHQCLLTAAHVLMAGASTTVYQPSLENEAQPIGSVRRSLFSARGDAGIAVLDRHRPVQPMPIGGVNLTGVRRVRMNEVLEKSGARTGVTRAKVTMVGECEIPYEGWPAIRMEGFGLRPLDPSIPQEISDGGDSGSVWYDAATGEAVGLTVAGDLSGTDDDEWTFCCHLDSVFDELEISLERHMP